MIQSRMIGDVKVTRVLEYSGPTHVPGFLFPDLADGVLERHRAMLAPDHWVPAMDRLVVTMQSWLVQTGDATILIDTGVGNHKPRPGAARMHMLNTLYLPWLEAAGAPADRVTHVVTTHLHMDHVGWNTVLDGDHWVPTFPNARYLVPRREFAAATAAMGDTPTRWFVDSVQPVIDAGLLDQVEVGDTIAGLLRIEEASGHTPGQVTLDFESGGESASFVTDVFHSPLQIVEPDLNTRYCEAPEAARATRRAVLERAADRGTLIMPFHFGAPYCGYVHRDGDGYAFEPATW